METISLQDIALGITGLITVASTINRYTKNETASKVLYFLLRLTEIISIPGKDKMRLK